MCFIVKIYQQLQIGEEDFCRSFHWGVVALWPRESSNVLTLIFSILVGYNGGTK